MTTDDDLMAELRTLPERDVDARRADQLRRAARRVLVEERDLRERPALRAAVHLWDRVLQPALLTGVSCVYLIWAVQSVLALYR